MWHVIYTKPKAESRVAETLRKINVEVYCPMVTEVRQWSDRKKKLSVPLFRSYVFIRITEKERHKVFDVPGVVKYLYWLGKPALARDSEIDTIKNWLCGGKVEDVVIENLTPGERVVIKSGAFKDQEAIIKKVGPSRIRLVLVDLGCTVTANTRDVLQEVSA